MDNVLLLDQLPIDSRSSLASPLGGPGDPVLEVRNAVKTFGQTQALRGASLQVRAGEVHGLVGANGAGKSTLVKAISGALRLDSGTIGLGDFSGPSITTREAHAQGLATIYQDPSLVPTLGLTENVMLGREASRAGIFLLKSRERREVASSLVTVGLTDRPYLTAGELTPSEQQLLEVAAAIHRRARVVIMDEPTAAMGNTERDRIFEVISVLRAQGVGILYISHKLHEVLSICDRITVMRDGRDVATGAADSLDQDRVVRLMIGRELKKAQRTTRALGEIALKVSGLGQSQRLRNISFDLHTGEILGITGLVGSGRSRLGRTLFGAEHFDEGRIELFGIPYKPSDPHAAIAAGVGLVPQDRRREALLMSMSIRDNITLARMPMLSRLMVNVSAQRVAARRWVEHLKIKTFSIVARPSELSGGNQQKVSIARWLHAKARVVIFDEPGQAVDVGAKGEIFAAIRQLADEGAGVIVISDDIEELQQMVDRLLVMRAGRITGELAPDEITEELVLALEMKSTTVSTQES